MKRRKLEEKKEKIKLDFTKKEYDYFCENCMFSELQENILKDRIKGLSRIEIELKYNISESKLDKEIRKIKNKILKEI